MQTSSFFFSAGQETAPDDNHMGKTSRKQEAHLEDQAHSLWRRRLELGQLQLSSNEKRCPGDGGTELNQKLTSQRRAVQSSPAHQVGVQKEAIYLGKTGSGAQGAA